jgi:uncharacterized protein
VETRRYTLEELRVNIVRKKLSSGALKILHLSDLHLACPESHKLEFLRRVSDNDYDLVFLSGDVFEDYSGTPYASEILARRPRLGAYAVLGNHDYYEYTMFHKTIGRLVRRYRHPAFTRDVTPLIASLEAGGFTVLRNNTVNLADAGISIVGIDYPGPGASDLRTLIAQAPAGNLIILLAHMPWHLDLLAGCGVDLALCGHTHGGQICLPGIGAIFTDSDMPGHQASGLIARGDTTIHISRGLGADPKTNYRLFCPPTATALYVD